MTRKKNDPKSSSNDESDYYNSQSNSICKYTTQKNAKVFSVIDKTLFALAFAPLIDGLYISCLTNGLMSSSIKAVIFGTTALSGGGCIGAVISNQESKQKKFISICLVYAIIFMSSIFIGLFKPIFVYVAPENFAILTSAFLITLGIKISGFHKLDKMWGINPGCAIRVIMLAFFLNAIQVRPIFGICSDWNLMMNISVAVLSGFAFICLGLLFSALTTLCNNFDFSWLKKGQAGSLILMGFKIIFPIIPAWLVLIPLAFGFLFGFIKMSSELNFGTSWKPWHSVTGQGP